MAAPSNIVWGDKVKDYDRVGISISQSYTNGQCTVTAEVWFWTKYSLTSNYAKTYFEFDTTVVSDTAAGTTTPINTKNDSGSGWSTKNQVKLGTYTKTYDRTANGVTRNCAVKVNGLSNTSSNVTATTSYTINALPRYTLSFNANGGSVSETSRTLFYGYEYGDLPTPTRTGYTFTGWYTQQSGGTKVYNTTTMGSSNVTIYAHWRANTLTISYHVGGGAINSDRFYSSNSIVYSKSDSKVATTIATYNNIVSTAGLYNASTFGLYRTGYTFLGWKVGSNGTTIFDEDDATIKPTDLTSDINTGDCEIRMYAVWEIMGVMRIKQNNAWKTGITWIKTKSGWKLGIPYKKINGVWKQGGI